MKNILPVFILFIAFLIISMLSCKKPTGPSCVDIIVKSKDGENPITGASIRLHQDKLSKDTSIKGTIDNSLLEIGKGTTDGSGKASFCYDEEAIWELEVTHPDYQTNNDFVRLQAHKSITKSVLLER